MPGVVLLLGSQVGAWLGPPGCQYTKGLLAQTINEQTGHGARVDRS